MGSMDAYELGTIEWLKTASPDEWHNVARSWNWDNDLYVIQWMTMQPHCDLGTVLLCYWRTAPRWLRQYESMNELTNDHDRELWQLQTQIEEQVTGHFYSKAEFSYDPTDDDGTDWTEEYADKPQKRDIPAQMFTPTVGREVPFEYYPDGIPDEVADAVESASASVDAN